MYAFTMGHGGKMRLRKESDDIHEDEIVLIAKVSDALAHPIRIKIFRFIMNCNAERVTVCNKDVVENFDYSQGTISQHIKKLVQADLVQVKRKDSFSMYYVNIGVFSKYLDAVKKFE
jgi:ArsR family transcriptional regulator